MTQRSLSVRAVRTAALAACCLMGLTLAALVWEAWRSGGFASPAALAGHLRRYGFLAPAALMVMQFCQVVVPVLPGALGCIAGVLLFGPAAGFLYNYLAVCLGSLAAYGLAYRWGEPLALALLGRPSYEKHSGWLRHPRFAWVFLAAILLPLAPDDVFCYLAGLGRMKPLPTLLILLLGKPWVILGYSLGLQLFT